MPAFNQQQLSYKARNSNSVTILIGDQPIGFAQTASHTFDFGAEQLYGIGSAMPQEVQQLRVSPTITLDNFALTQQGLTSLGYPANLAVILSNNSFNFFVVDGQSGQALFTYVGCVASNFNENIPANRPITDAITFLAMDVLGSNGQSILNQGNAYQPATQVPVGVGGNIGFDVGVITTPGG